MTDAEFWEIERELWLGGQRVFRRWMSADCLMVFPEPAGILTGPAILDSLSAGPRWNEVNLEVCHLRRNGTASVVLAYRAAARRPDGELYWALCSSGYVLDAGAWWLVHHQQTRASSSASEGRQA